MGGSRRMVIAVEGRCLPGSWLYSRNLMHGQDSGGGQQLFWEAGTDASKGEMRGRLICWSWMDGEAKPKGTFFVSFSFGVLAGR